VAAFSWANWTNKLLQTSEYKEMRADASGERAETGKTPMSEQDAVLFANDAFYAAFHERDFDAMIRVWSANQPVSCTHPGWQTLDGLESVLESWNAILTNPQAPVIKCRARRAAIYGSTAVVTCIEELEAEGDEQEFLAATNIFVKEGSLWLMVHHQAGPVHVDIEVFEGEEEPPALN